jgi:hypothetical protein
MLEVEQIRLVQGLRVAPRHCGYRGRLKTGKVKDMVNEEEKNQDVAKGRYTGMLAQIFHLKDDQQKGSQGR